MLESGDWQKMVPFGRGPLPRRRQGCVVVENRVFFFGGTSPAADDEDEDEDPMEPEESNLVDHDDLYVLDMGNWFNQIKRVSCHNLALAGGVKGWVPKLFL